jgi:hypothetical protein
LYCELARSNRNVDHERLAVLADDDGARLDVPMQHPAAVRVLDRIADVGKTLARVTA